MILPQKDIHAGNLILVNAGFGLRTVDEKGLLPVDLRYPDILMQREAVNALCLALEKIRGTDKIVPVSGYRCEGEQIQIYEDSLRDNGEEFTGKYVALPNHSEHQTGLAIDLGLKKEKIDFIRPDFPYDGICGEFRRVAPQYGFVERYPGGKEHYTGIAHEPWHFRYVGYPHSEIMTEREMTLEEYIGFIRRFSFEGEHFRMKKLKKQIEIYFVPAKSGMTAIPIPESWIYQISGNNIDGFIVTVWRDENES